MTVVDETSHPRCGSMYNRIPHGSLLSDGGQEKPGRQRLLETLAGPSTEALERLIYIVGVARGGTSVLQAMLGIHDGLIAMPGPSAFMAHVWRYRRRLHERLWRQLLWTPHYLRRAIVRDSLSDERRTAYVRLVNRAVAEKDLHDLYQLYPLTLALDPAEQRDPKSLVAWLDKGNDFWGVDQLPAAFPSGRFVMIVRDPRGAVASLAKRLVGDRTDMASEVRSRDIVDAAIHWRNMVRQQRRFARRHPGRTIVLRFEDLTRQPLAVCTALFRALGLPSVNDDVLAERIESLVYSATNEEIERRTGISTAPNERWREQLDSRSLDLIAAICGRSARGLGYDLAPRQRGPGWLEILACMPGARAKLRTFAKLGFLTLTDRRPSVTMRRTVPKLLSAE